MNTSQKTTTKKDLHHKVRADMLISEILEMIPESVDIMLDGGLHCVGCGANSEETLQQGMESHGFTESEIEEMISKINLLAESLEDEKVQEEKPQEEDFKLKVLEEGNKTYYKVAGLTFSQKAYDNLHSLATEPGLQIRLTAGGCAGFNLQYDFKASPQSDEKSFPLSDKLAIYINDFSFAKLTGATVDFESGLHGSGLKFHNPRAKKSCGCGTSFNF